MKKYIAVVEVAAVLAVFFYLKDFLKNSGFGDWQIPLLGAALVSSCILFFILPLTATLIGHRNPGSVGLTNEDLSYHSQRAVRAMAFVAPATILFPVIGLLGTTHEEWLGASILTIGFAATGLLYANKSRNVTNGSESALRWTGLVPFIALLVFGLIASYVLHTVSPLATRVVAVLVFVAFLEEFFFRGYVQSRLNDCFGRPFSFQNVNFGAGLLLSAVLFGLFHPLSVADNTPWAWAMWTAAGGLIFGFLREKTGSIIAPAMLHGAILLPGVFFAPS